MPKTVRILSIAAAAGIALSACGGPAAYVHQGKFVRTGPQAAATEVPPASVTVCYNKSSTTPTGVLRLASDECGRFGRRVAFVRQSRSVCPLATPMAAIYECVDPKGESGIYYRP